MSLSSLTDLFLVFLGRLSKLLLSLCFILCESLLELSAPLGLLLSIRGRELCEPRFRLPADLLPVASDRAILFLSLLINSPLLLYQSESIPGPGELVEALRSAFSVSW